MAGLVPAIHVFVSEEKSKTWMPAKSGHDEVGGAKSPTRRRSAAGDLAVVPLSQLTLVIPGSPNGSSELIGSVQK
jgi:hypothetical protein